MALSCCVPGQMSEVGGVILGGHILVLRLFACWDSSKGVSVGGFMALVGGWSEGTLGVGC